MDNDGQLFDLDYSSCANYIGASTIAITKDDYIIIGQQGDHSKANPGRYAPSGSGSVNYSDLKVSRNFNSLLINAMEREFSEENNCSPEKDSIKTILIGYCRLIERGGKPDFFGITRINKNLSELSISNKFSEKGIAKNSIMIKIDPVLGLGRSLEGFCQQHIEKKKLSIQLKIMTDIIINAEEEILERLG